MALPTLLLCAVRMRVARTAILDHVTSLLLFDLYIINNIYIPLGVGGRHIIVQVSILIDIPIHKELGDL